ncbi:MAG: hypothetical protein QOI12_2764 [Alphaproteobacteria bacterium]|nr:hypothetical protein [Alphaproteobacteria bacterium]
MTGVLLTGASSFFGSYLTEHFLRAGKSVTATFRTGNAVVERLRALGKTLELELVELDIGDAAGFARLPSTAATVVHVAGVSSVDGVSDDEMFTCNVIGTRNVLNYSLSAGARRMIFASSLSVHGRIDVSVVDENTPVNNPSPYGASKYKAERLLAGKAAELPCICVRLPGVLGRGAHRAWVPTMLERIRARKDVTIFNPEAAFNNAAHIRDLARFFDGLTQRDWRGFFAFPVGAAGAIPIRQVADRLMMGTNLHGRIITVHAPQSSFTVSSDCARSFGYDPMEITAMLDLYVAESLLPDDRS